MCKSKYYSNSDCEYYKTCHNGKEKNCMFCFCPLYPYDCPGDFVMLENGKKDCSNCFLPHSRESYDLIIDYLKKNT